MRIAFAGNPNSGKTTMYNALTGLNEKVGNWAGVTVDKKEGRIKKGYFKGEELFAVDLPGAYSMSPFTNEESITRDYIKNTNIDVIVNIVDSTNLSRSLFFTTQLLELGIPVVVALNKSDINKKKETKIDVNALSKELGCPVVKTVSVSGKQYGLKELVKCAVDVCGTKQTAPFIQKDVDFGEKNSVIEADKNRFKYVNALVERIEERKIRTNQLTLQDKIDKYITSKWLGIPIFALVMFLVFQISQAWVGPFIADTLVGLLEHFQAWVGELLNGASPFLSAILVDGIIGGVIAVIGFLPLVMIMYFLIAILEDCGYMSRVAVVLDPIFKRVGLSGKSVIPFVITVGCAVPGIMASRTIRNERERRSAVMLAPFMPCGAKIPVIALFAGVFFNNAGWVSTLMYISGIALIFMGAVLVNKITANKAKKSFFIIELAEYKIPSLWEAFKSMCSRGWEYIVKAATIILLCNTAVQIMQSFSFDLRVAETSDTSILAWVAGPASYVLVPIVGVLSWQLAAAAITGFIAKENVVGTLAVCFSITNFIDTEELTLTGGNETVATVMGLTKVGALAYLMFNLFTPPCFAAIGAMNSEMKSRKWLWGGIGLQFGVGYTVSYFIYTIGTLITNPELLDLTAAISGGIAVTIMIGVVVFLINNTNRKLVKVKQ